MSVRPETASRRRFLGGALALPTGFVAGSGLLADPGPWIGVAHAAPAIADPTSRAAFDELDLAFNDGHGYRDETNDKDSSGLSGKLAWGEAYVLQAYALMYEAHGDTHYLDKMVDHLDRVLANRDSERGVSDHAGHSHPAWRADDPYTVGYATLTDADGAPVFEIRSALAYADSCTVSVTPGSAPGLFSLDIENAQYDRVTSHRDLSADPESPDYAVTRLTEGFHAEAPARVLVTVRDLRESGQQTGAPQPDTLTLESRPYVFEVHTGQIVLPMVQFARIVFADPDLANDDTYLDRAETYLDAAEAAVAVHDPEWRENELGEGWYVTGEDAPVWHAGMDNPLNHFLSLGRAILQLALATGKQEYVDRAAAMELTLRNSLEVGDNGAFTWPYWWPKGDAYAGWDIDEPRSSYRPWYPANTVAEDTSHGQIEVNFALEAYRAFPRLRVGHRPRFGAHDLTRLAATFTRNVAATDDDGRATVRRFVDGSGDTGLEAYERQAAAWAGLTPWDDEVLEHLTEIFTTREFALQPSTLYCVAWLNHAKRGARPR